MTNTFLSTSKDPDVAHVFANYDSTKKQLWSVLPDRNISVGFTYVFKKLSGSRRAIDISQLSTKPAEEEVLIFPYSVFVITNIDKFPCSEQNAQRFEIELEEYDGTQIVIDYSSKMN